MAIILLSCNDDFISTQQAESIAKDQVIEIKTTRNEWNILQNGMKLKSSSGDPNFVDTKEVESTESVVLPELVPHIWVGNILRKSSIANCDYKPLIYPRNPITVSLTLMNTSPKTISNPTFSTYLGYIQEQTAKGNFSQNSEFNLSIEQFTSYNELKVAFGSNVNSSFLFWGSSTGTELDQHTINKATGIYVKFFQTSFKAVMDYPAGSIASIPSNLIDSAVYINSISYGRLGIMTLETNSTVQYSKEIVNKVFHKIFSSGSSTLTTEEKNFLDGCDYKLYMIGGNGSTAVESFIGYQGFIQHIKSGKFSKNEPGTALFCTFNHVKDNSPVKTRFKFDIKKEPLYVELSKKKDGVYMNFYRSRSKVPTIANPNIKFPIRITEKTDFAPGGSNGIYANDYGFIEGTYHNNYDFYNSGYQTDLKISNLKSFYSEDYVGDTSHGAPCYITHQYQISINKSPSFEIIGSGVLP